MQYYGGFWQRFLAIFIDGLILLGIDAVVKFSMGINPLNLTEIHPNAIYAFLINMVVGFSYYTFFQAKFKGTLGKHALGLVVVDEETLTNMSIGQASARYFMQFVSGLIFCLGYITVGINQRKQGWHDKVAKTLVVKKSCLKKLHEDEGVLPETRFKKSQLKIAA